MLGQRVVIARPNTDYDMDNYRMKKGTVVDEVKIKRLDKKKIDYARYKVAFDDNTWCMFYQSELMGLIK